MPLAAYRQGDLLIVHAQEDRIDAAGALQFKEDMRAATLAGATRVILDLSRVTFLDSSGLGAVVAVRKQLAPGRTLELAGLTPPLQRLFHLTRMDTVFTIHPNIASLMPQAEEMLDAG